MLAQELNRLLISPLILPYRVARDIYTSLKGLFLELYVSYYITKDVERLAEENIDDDFKNKYGDLF